MYRGVTGYNFEHTIVVLYLKIIFVLTNSIDPGGMSHEAVFHLGLHCLPKCHLGVSRIE